MEKEESTLSEDAAELFHALWAEWMNQMLAAVSTTESGDKVISAKLVAIWRHQAETPYIELYEYEKDFARERANCFVSLFICRPLGRPYARSCGG
jgi:hypothetical protein